MAPYFKQGWGILVGVIDILLQWFGLETAKQHVWGGP
jgi:hypothetical protein